MGFEPADNAAVVFALTFIIYLFLATLKIDNRGTALFLAVGVILIIYAADDKSGSTSENKAPDKRRMRRKMRRIKNRELVSATPYTVETKSDISSIFSGYDDRSSELSERDQRREKRKFIARYE